MKILLINQYIRGSVSKEETFWSFLERNLEDASSIELSSFNGDLSNKIKEIDPDVVVYNSGLGKLELPDRAKSIVILQDDFIAMGKILPKSFPQKIKKIFSRDFYTQSIKQQRQAMESSDKIVAVSKSVADSYNVDAEIIPIGTDKNLFKPIENKSELRNKFGIPADKNISIFVGSTHAVKGYDLLEKEIQSHPENFYIVVLKDELLPSKKFLNAKYFSKLEQSELAKLYNCADQYIGFSRVETLWLTPIEAMFCDTPVKVSSVGIFKDWKPENKNPREEAIQKGLDQENMLARWKALLSTI